MGSVLEQIQVATEKLNQGDVVGMPTETVYGLAAKIDSEAALKKIFAIKERPFFDPLIVHVASLAQAKSCYKTWTPLVDKIANKFWPGPLTLVRQKSDQISDLITSGLESVGVRWPNHPVAQDLIRAVGVPLAAPSANKFGKTSPTQALHVRKEFDDQVFVLDAGASAVGIESTVLLVKDNSELAILRKGVVLQSEIESYLKDQKLRHVWLDVVDKKESPGHMKHHYMPDIPFVICRNPSLKLSELAFILNSKLNELPDVVEGVKMTKPKHKIEKIEFLRLPKDPYQAARELYSLLRAASARRPEVLCFIQMPQQSSEMWESVFDRLYKAASLIID